MVRKRKIPVRKHHGVRDPIKQLEEKEKRLKNVINNPPERDNDQKPSFKFQQFKKLADAAKAGKKFKQIKSGTEDKPKGATKRKENDKFRAIKQMPGEDDSDYLRRVNRITRESLNEAKYEAKYGVKVIKDPKTGEITIKKKPPNEIDELLKRKREQLKSRKGNKKNKLLADVKPMDSQMVKELVKQAIREDNQDKKQHIEEYKRDIVKFGEIVHAPPSLSTLPRKAKKFETVSRPGRKNNLLLKELLTSKVENNTAKNPTTKPQGKKGENKVTKNQLKGKRKNLPMATRNMLETEQKKLIALYRDLKKSKHQVIEK